MLLDVFEDQGFVVYEKDLQQASQDIRDKISSIRSDLPVEMKEPVKFERFAPVTVNGRFFVDPQPKQGYIYRMEGESVASAARRMASTCSIELMLKAGSP